MFWAVSSFTFGIFRTCLYHCHYSLGTAAHLSWSASFLLFSHNRRYFLLLKRQAYMSYTLVTWAATRQTQSYKTEPFTRRNTQPLHKQGSRHCAETCEHQSVCKQAMCRTLCKDLMGIFHPTLSYVTLKKLPRTALHGSGQKHVPGVCRSWETVNHYLEMGIYSSESSCICCLADTATHLLSWMLTAPSIFFPFPAAGLQKTLCCPHFPQGWQQHWCFTLLTALSKNVLVTDLSCSSTTWLCRALCFIHQGTGSL